MDDFSSPTKFLRLRKTKLKDLLIPDFSFLKFASEEATSKEESENAYLGQCCLTVIFPSKVVADRMHPIKEDLLFSIGGFILIVANISLVVKLLPTFSIICLWKCRFLFGVLVMQ